MLIFGRKPPQPEPEPRPDVVARLVALEELTRKLEKRANELELDWREWFDKFRLLYARLSKRVREAAAAVVEADDDGSESRQDAPGSTNSPRGIYPAPKPNWPPQGTGRGYR